MRRKFTKLLALLLALLLLSGCGGQPPATLRQTAAKLSERAAEAPEEETGEDMPRFRDIPYERPDLEALQGDAQAVEAALQLGAGLDELEELINTACGAYEHFMTMATVAMIRSFQDTGDAYYAREYAWCDAKQGEVMRCMEQMYYACGESEFASELEERAFYPGFAEDYADRSKAVYSPEVVALMDRESELLSRFYQLRTESEEGLMSRLGAVREDSGYYPALIDNYRAYNDQLGQVYIELVRVRRELAEARGYDSYEAMAYETDYARDYTSSQAAAYDEDVKTWIVPLYRQVAGMSRSYADVSGLSTRRLFRTLKNGAAQMGGVVDDAFRFMSDYGLYDIREDPAKADVSFEAYLDEYAAPFLFVSSMGSLMDLTSFAHEFGHFVDAYVNGDSDRSVDVAEIFSLTMEYLMLTWTGDALSEEERLELKREKLMDSLDLFIQQCSYNAFEQAVYAADPDTLTVEWLNEQSLLLAMDYGYYDGVSEEYFALSWTDIDHLFEAPFYVAAYPPAEDLALQLYQRELEEEGAGLEGFLTLLDESREGLVETAEAVGLESPFAAGRVERLSRSLSALLLP